MTSNDEFRSQFIDCGSLNASQTYLNKRIVMIGSDMIFWYRQFTRLNYQNMIRRVHEMNQPRKLRLAGRSDEFRSFEKVVSANCLQMTR